MKKPCTIQSPPVINGNMKYLSNTIDMQLQFNVYRLLMNALKTILFYVYHIPITNKHYWTPAIIIAITMSSPELSFILWG